MLVCYCAERRRIKRGRIVDKDVESAGPVDDSVDQGCHAGCIGEVTLEDLRRIGPAFVEPCGEFRGLRLGAAIVNRHVGAVVVE